MRRLDINDDGVVSVEEIDTFFGGFTRLRQRKFATKPKVATPTCQRKLRSFSPNRKIAEGRMVMMSPGKASNRVIYEEEIAIEETTDVEDHTVVPPPKPQTVTILGEQEINFEAPVRKDIQHGPYHKTKKVRKVTQQVEEPYSPKRRLHNRSRGSPSRVMTTTHMQ